ncbi:hypothetical protein [Lactobacillus gigeriorum]|uniref:D-alanine-D-alanine ligase n=1 Tax=Lactobacillus gigeriorum DSM 23908 = CRBIP 24.85 TaxID=1423751 RepID=I7K1W9_9LACO|nr:hypothetical protein [Lactobacillus gigeriorum]CCI87695.1 D-alanine-D-alanine ligase [Lactobacillus gigeriorum DSM 23908 = CRBIP 24.85]
MTHMSRREYRMRSQKAKESMMRSGNQRYQKGNGSRSGTNASYQLNRLTGSRFDYVHANLNFWKIFSDRPYVSVAIIVLAIFLAMSKLWWGLVVLAVVVAVGIYVIARSHHPDQVLSIEFKLKASRKLSMLRSLQFGGSILMFLSTYMKQVVTVNFSSAGSTDSLQVIENMLSSHGFYGQQGSYFLSLLNTLTGGQLWGSYRYATNSAQMMSSGAGRNIVMWVLLLMIAPALCVLAQFFREPYSRNVSLLASIVSLISFGMTPRLMKKWLLEYAVQNQLSQDAASQAITIGPMAYVAILCALVVTAIAFYRFVKKDNFE